MGLSSYGSPKYFEEIGGILKYEIDILKNLIGIYQHFYEDNFLGNKEFDSHYIVLAFKLVFDEIVKSILEPKRIKPNLSPIFIEFPFLA